MIQLAITRYLILETFLHFPYLKLESINYWFQCMDYIYKIIKTCSYLEHECDAISKEPCNERHGDRCVPHTPPEGKHPREENSVQQEECH